MVRRAVGVYVLGVIALQIAMLTKSMIADAASTPSVFQWSSILLVASGVSLAIAAVGLMREGELQPTAANVGLSLLMTWLLLRLMSIA